MSFSRCSRTLQNLNLVKKVPRRCLVTLPKIVKVHEPKVQNKILHPPFDIEIPQQTYTDFVWSGLEGQAHLPALVCGISGRTLNHGEVQELSLRLSASLQSSSLKKGDVVGVLLPNCPEYAVVALGTLHAGLTITTLNPIYTPHELAHQLKASNAKILVTSYEVLQKVKDTEKIYEGLELILMIDAEAKGETNLHKYGEHFLPFSYYLSSKPALSSPPIDIFNDYAILPFSSGTTGAPKGVCLSHRNLVTQCITHVADGEWIYRAFGQFQDVTVSVLPMFHIYGLGVTMTACLWAGAKQVTLPRFDSKLYIQNIADHKPTFLHVVPPIFSFLATSLDVTSSHLSSLRQINCGAAPCGTELINKFYTKAPKSVIFKEGWGMTEVAGGACVMNRAYQEVVNGSVNLVNPNFRMRIADPDTNTVKDAGETGEIQVLGEGVMIGYLNNPKANQDTFTPDGWLKTGDIGHFTDEGLLFVSDRIKELIKVNGLQVAPAELEDILRGIDGVDDVAVTGVEDERSGQLPRAFIVSKEGVTEETIHEYMKEHLAKHKQLAGGIVFIDEIPKSAAGKILRRQLSGK